MQYKKFIPCVYIYHKSAVRSITDHTIISSNPVELAKLYSESGADELLITEISHTDEEHEDNLGIMKQICSKVEVPVIGSGTIHRMEDVKKILYAGCMKAVINFTSNENSNLLEEVSLKFGQSKIAVSLKAEAVFLEAKDIIEKYSSEVFVSNLSILRGIEKQCSTPICVTVEDLALDKMFELLKNPCISGITGSFVIDNAKQIFSLKDLCKEHGVETNVEVGAIPFEELKLGTDGLIPVVVQDYKTNEVLMVAYMNEEAYKQTLRIGKMTYFSRSRQNLWLKGETSGHYQYVKELRTDCDKDTLLAKVSQVGAACHTGSYSCFFHEIMKKEYDNTNPLMVFEEVFSVIKDRKINPKEGSYTNYLFDKGIDKILKKLGEEATEIVIASKNPNPEEIKYEISDFLYHMMVLMVEKGVSWEEITTELANR